MWGRMRLEWRSPEDWLFKTAKSELLNKKAPILGQKARVGAFLFSSTWDPVAGAGQEMSRASVRCVCYEGSIGIQTARKKQDFDLRQSGSSMI